MGGMHTVSVGQGFRVGRESSGGEGGGACPAMSRSRCGTAAVQMIKAIPFLFFIIKKLTSVQ